jgi:hypothetical protein
LLLRSPIELIPDFRPMLGQLDQMINVPLGIALAVRFSPSRSWRRCCARPRRQGRSWRAIAVVLVWAGFPALGVWAWRAR